MRSRTCDIPPNAVNVGDCSDVPLLETRPCNLGECPGQSYVATPELTTPL